MVIDVIALGWVGANRPEGIYVVVGRAATFYYFFHFLILLPLLVILERPLPLPASIAPAISSESDAHQVTAPATTEKP